MDYGNLFARAWKITWNNKILWLFGLFAGTGGFNFNFNSSSRGGTGGAGGTTPLPPGVQRQLEQFFSRPEAVATIIAIACVFFIFVIALVVLSLIARGGLITGINLAETNGTVTFGEAWAGGTRNALRLFLLGVVAALPILIIIVPLVLLTVLTGGAGALCLIPVVCVLVILAIPYSLVLWLATFSLVLDNTGIIDSFKRGWELLKTNIAPVLIVGIILGIGGLIIGFIMLIPVLVVAAPALITFISDPRHPNMTMLVGSGVAFLCLLPILWTVGAVVSTYIYSTWTLLYRQIAGTGQAPAIPVAPSAPASPYMPA